MIDIVTTEGCDLKNVTQIGTPGAEGKIYIKDTPYARIHMEEFSERRVFVLMGHTEHGQGSYMTFVEEVIPVPDIAFQGDAPLWTNKVWNQVYQEIRERFDKLIVVGWALDIKGLEPRITMELESVHREYFGGLHQILFLLDTAGGEEYFYINKNNHLYRKPGFYVYYSSGKKHIEKMEEPRLLSRPEAGSRMRERSLGDRYVSREPASFRENRLYRSRDTAAEHGNSSGGRYRRLLLSGEAENARSTAGGFPTTAAVFAAAVLIAAIAGTLISRDPGKMSRVEDMISALSDKVSGKTITFISTEDSGAVETERTEAGEKATDEDTQVSTEKSGYTPVEKVDGGIPKNK